MRQTGGRYLSDGEECVLLIGFPLGADRGFETREQMERAWWLHRDRLLLEALPLTRPFGYWAIETSIGDRIGREPEEDALLRLGLELSPQEKGILAMQAPIWIPETVPSGAIDYWERKVSSLEVRRSWHQREGRQEQARAWGEQCGLLKARISEAKNTREEQK